VAYYKILENALYVHVINTCRASPGQKIWGVDTHVDQRPSKGLGMAPGAVSRENEGEREHKAPEVENFSVSDAK